MKSMKNILLAVGACVLIAGAYYVYNKRNAAQHDVKIQVTGTVPGVGANTQFSRLRKLSNQVLNTTSTKPTTLSSSTTSTTTT